MSAESSQEPSAEARVSALLGGYRATQMLFVAVTLALPDLLAEGPRSIAELARESRAHPEALCRLLRGLSSVGVFWEREDGRFENCPLSVTLRADHPSGLRALAHTYGQPWWWGSYGELLYSVRTGRPGFDKVTGVPIYDFLRDHPEAQALFDANMTTMTRREATAVMEAGPFDGETLLVDVGGGRGILAALALARNPGLRAVVFDRPAVVAEATAALAEHGVEDRAELVGGDFFDSVPAGGSVYVLKDILHNWHDAKARTILGNCRRALADGGRLLVIERVLPHDNEPCEAKLVDVTMLVQTGGRERLLDEYARLFDDCSFRLGSVRELATGNSIVEALPV